MSQPERRKTIRATIGNILAYTKAESLAELDHLIDQLRYGQEIEVRLAKNIPQPMKSSISDQPAKVTIALVQLSSVPVHGQTSS